MRRFSSYGPINTKVHYYSPRKKMIDKAYTQLMGSNPDEGGHYITVWAPRQTGKTWIMQQILFQLRKDERFDVLKINLEHLKDETNAGEIINTIAEEIGEGLGKTFTGITTQKKFQKIFKKGTLEKPLILILDEFDALLEKAINAIVGAFRNIYTRRIDETGIPMDPKSYLLHGVALIGVRSVLGIESKKGSPFNIQRGLHIPNLTYDEVNGLFRWYEKETGQKVHQDVIDGVFYETNGQPGLTCWFGELLTETYNEGTAKGETITMKNFEEVHAAAVKILPNNNILNIISKANEEPYKKVVLELFKTDRKIEFSYDNTNLNYLYMNGVIEQEKENRTEYYVKFASPFVQERMFYFFSNELFLDLGTLYDPFENLDDTITETHLDIGNLVKHYRVYLKKNREWLLADAPRRKDMRIYEAVYHFNFYSYLNEFLRNAGGRVFPEFPTGNGKIDLIVTYAGKKHGIELKSYSNERNYKEALKQAANYGKKLQLPEIFLVLFVEYVDEKSRKKYETLYRGEETAVTVIPLFVETGK